MEPIRLRRTLAFVPWGFSLELFCAQAPRGLGPTINFLTTLSGYEQILGNVGAGGKTNKQEASRETCLFAN